MVLAVGAISQSVAGAITARITRCVFSFGFFESGTLCRQGSGGFQSMAMFGGWSTDFGSAVVTCPCVARPLQNGMTESERENCGSLERGEGGRSPFLYPGE